ncbi:uncharacterized protein LOC120738489 [Simochromis diagramma]|uniref:uncharacterized protein LOC120738489 n=1 Tax=Simochromis diagramma TaxID=43689 RepID=UPI001A7E24F3|nr:uncharacterized protein LOC120738489 [Simochromis diagramma]
MDMTTEDGYCHPPAVFSIGADRGFLVYAGQPQACRKCGSTGHNADNCEQVRCRSCGKNGHITRDCKEPRRCHLCDSDTHMARDCTRPRSYSEAAKAGTEVERYEETDTGANNGESAQEVPPAERNQTNEEKGGGREDGAEQGKEKGDKMGEKNEEKQSEEGQIWEVAAKPRRKSAKRRRKVSLGVPPGGTILKEVTPFLSKWNSGAEQAGPEICPFSQANRAYRDAGSRDEESLRLPARPKKHTLWLLFKTYKSFAFY